MTIIVGVACPEGLVLAADSRSSLFSADKFRIATDSAKKLFSLGAPQVIGASDRFVVATYGWSMLGGITIAGHIDDLRDSVLAQPPANPTEAAEDVAEFFEPLVEQEVKAIEQATGIGLQPGELKAAGFLVGGYDEHRTATFLDVELDRRASSLRGAQARRSSGGARSPRSFAS